MTNKYTAVARNKPSRVMRFLDSKSLLVGEVLDFGCGRGFDVKHYHIDGYDPNWGPVEFPTKKYDTITCNWVLNVVSPKEQDLIIDQIKGLLKPEGTAYLTVRREIKEDYVVKDYVQRLVYLDLPTLVKNSDYQIYILRG
jgi:2-polyprenyl-3-methyl-5-hydroxy-6-metoxy-1,4-benzoquinol methylase